MNQRDVASVVVGGNRVNLRPSLPEADISGKPCVTVSAVGLANGLSDKFNGGSDFGPDTSGTQSMGAAQAANYLFNKYGGGLIKFTSGNFAINEKIPLLTGVSFEGEHERSTILYTDTAGMNIFDNLGANSFYNTIRRLQIASSISINGKTSAQVNIGVNGALASELGGWTELDHIIFTGQFGSYWFDMTNSDQFVAKHITLKSQSSSQAVGFKAVNSQFTIYDSYLEGLNITGDIGSQYNQMFVNCQTDTLRLNIETRLLTLIDHYNYDSGLPVVELNGFNLDNLFLTGYIGVKNGNAFFSNKASTATIARIFSMVSGASYLSDGNASNSWFATNAGAYTDILKLRIISGFIINNAVSGMPFQNGNIGGTVGFITGLGFNATTPALPAATGSADAVANTNPYDVKIYQAGASGTHIIDVAGNDVALPADPVELTLTTGSKIYYATTVATSWKWFGVL